MSGQSKSELEKERNQINRDIERTTRELGTARKTKQKSIEELKALENQVNDKKQLINDIKSEVVINDQQLNENIKTIEHLKAKENLIIEQYKQMLRISYLKRQCQSDWTFLLSSSSLNHLLLRWRYLKQFENFTKQKIVEILNNREEIAIKNNEIESIKAQKEKSLLETSQNMDLLQKEKKAKDALLSKLSTTESSLASKLKKREADREKLNNAIENLIIAELSRSKSKEKDDISAYRKRDVDNTDFAKNRGSLPWPVSSGKITSKFGIHPHPIYPNLEVTNSGIDITLSQSGNAESIFDGEVSGIISIPGYNNVVMVNHGSYKTIYGKLATVFVSNGQKVKKGQKLGSVANDEDGNIVFHFELWKDKTKLNPQNWLSK
jgi:septal ring factor EnvC (AmiA/AmiB activator)